MTRAEERVERRKALDEEIAFKLTFRKSAETIARELGLSKSAVEKHLNALS